MRVKFNTIFEATNEGITNYKKVRIGGTTFYEHTLNNYKGTLAGIDFNYFAGRDLEVGIDGDTYVITGIY